MNTNKNDSPTRIDRYKQNLREVEAFIDYSSDRLHEKDIAEDFKKKLLELIAHTVNVLEEYY